MGRHRAPSHRLRALAIVCLLLAPLTTGCAAALLGAGAAAGAGTYAYMQGEASETHPGGFDQVWTASLNAMRDMNFEVVDSTRDSLGGEIKARRPVDNDEVTLKVEPVGSDSTRVKVRVGVMGDEDESKRIQQRISTTLARL
jgi:hypothetical protein